MEFLDRNLKCSDCGNDFVFTAGEQLFFYDKQFKNDPKRCKLCKAKRAGMGRSAVAADGSKAAAALPLSRTETRTECSACGIETTVPFKPTQGRPVLCRSCFQMKRVPTAVAAVATMDAPGAVIAQANEAFEAALAAGGVDVTAGVETTSGMSAVTEAPQAVISEPDMAGAAVEAAVADA
jgi:CxxC-x17-CxxC domain-containing protein